jgi:hypothetical protein
MIKSTESLSSRYDGSVRSALDSITEFVFGDTGFDPQKVQILPDKPESIPFFVDPVSVANQLDSEIGLL